MTGEKSSNSGILAGLDFSFKDNPPCSPRGAINLFLLKWDFQPSNLPIGPLILNMDLFLSYNIIIWFFHLRKF